MKINLDIQSLRSFIKVAELGSFTKASEVLHTTQPAISQQIRRLEEILGVDLFVRDNRITLLTLNGEKLLSYANDMVEKNDKISKLFLSSQHRTVVTLGMPEHFCEEILPKIISNMTINLPNVQLVVKVARSILISEAVNDGTVDLGLVIDETDRIQEMPWHSISAKWFASEQTNLHESKAVPLVLFKPPCSFRSIAISSLEKSGIDWYCAYECENLISLRSAVIAGAGITLLPHLSEIKGIKNIHLEGKLQDISSKFSVALRQRLGWNPSFKKEAISIIRDIWSEKINSVTL